MPGAVKVAAGSAAIELVLAPRLEHLPALDTGSRIWRGLCPVAQIRGGPPVVFATACPRTEPRRCTVGVEPGPAPRACDAPLGHRLGLMHVVPHGLETHGAAIELPGVAFLGLGQGLAAPCAPCVRLDLERLRPLHD